MKNCNIDVIKTCPNNDVNTFLETRFVVGRLVLKVGKDSVRPTVKENYFQKEVSLKYKTFYLFGHVRKLTGNCDGYD